MIKGIQSSLSDIALISNENRFEFYTFVLYIIEK